MHLQMLFEHRTEGFKMKITYLMAALLAGVITVGGNFAEAASCAEQVAADFGDQAAGVAGAKPASTIASEGVKCTAALQSALTTDGATITSLQSQIATNKAALATAQSQLAAAQQTDTADQAQITSLEGTIAQDNQEIASLQNEVNQPNPQLATMSTQLAQDQMTLQNTSNLLCNLWQLDCAQAQAQASQASGCGGNLICGFGVLASNGGSPNGPQVQYQNCTDMLNENSGVPPVCG